MSVKEPDMVDGMGIDEKNNILVLMIADPYGFQIQEYEHLKAIQTKINNYVGYIESKGYRSAYGNREFDGFRIELVFKHQYTENGKMFLNAGKKQLKERNIDFEYRVRKAD